MHRKNETAQADLGGLTDLRRAASRSSLGSAMRPVRWMVSMPNGRNGKRLKSNCRKGPSSPINVYSKNGVGKRKSNVVAKLNVLPPNC